MCVPTAITASLGALSTIASYKQAQDNYDYQKQIALNNYQENLDESSRQKQLGIEEARKEKLEGIKEANFLASKNASSGFDINSETLANNYNDKINSTLQNAKETQNEYDYKSDSYLNKANSYLEGLKNTTNSYNNSLFKNAITALGNSKLVNSSWYSNNTSTIGGNNGYI